MKVLLSHRIFYWGWVRLLLGTLQMACSTYAVFLIFQIGFQPVTWAFVLGAFAAGGVSRLLYRGRQDPDLKKNIKDGDPVKRATLD